MQLKQYCSGRGIIIEFNLLKAKDVALRADHWFDRFCDDTTIKYK